MLDTILFDLDGTLLPMDQTEFIHAYIGQLCRRYLPAGYQKDALVRALWASTAAMSENDGTRSNEVRFWDTLRALLGDISPLHDTIGAFFQQEFDAVRTVVRPTPLSRDIIDTLRDKGYTLALATNPFFPAVAVRTRLSWVGLTPEDFAHVTTYENAAYCKPRPEYYRAVLECLGKTPEQCRMIGNNPLDDMSAGALGLSLFLVTDCLENETDLPIDDFPQGSLASVLEWSRALPSL